MRNPGQRRIAGLIVTLFTLAAFGEPSHAALEPSTGPARAWLGISTERIEDGWRQREGYWANGVIVTAVTPGSPADRIGVQPGDVIVSLGSRVLRSPDQVTEIEQRLEPGDPVSLVIARQGGRMIRILNVKPDHPPGYQEPEAPVAPEAPAEGIRRDDDLSKSASSSESEESDRDESTVAEATPEANAVPVPEIVPMVDGGALGARCQTMNRDLAAALGAPKGRGVLVLEVQAGGAADRAGIKAGDIITRVGEAPVSNAKNLSSLLEITQGEIEVHTLHRGVRRIAQVTLASHERTAESDERVAVTSEKTESTPEAAPADDRVASRSDDPVVAPPDEPAADATEEKAGEVQVNKGGTAALGKTGSYETTRSAGPDPSLIELRDELHRLRSEVRRLRAELEELKHL